MGIAHELVRGEYLASTLIGLDFFDASIYWVAGWVIGTRNMLRALCIAMLEPSSKLKQLERSRDYTARLAPMEELKTMPYGAVWDHYYLAQDVPLGNAWLTEVRHYERAVLDKRS